MREFKKSELITMLNENSLEMDIDELADFKKQQGTEKSWEPIMSEPQDSKGYEGSYKARGSELRSGKAKGSHIGHKILDKTTKQPIVIIYPCLSQIDEFIQTHQSAINALKEEYGKFYISKKKTNPTCEPRVTTGEFEVYEPEGERQTIDARVRFDSEIADAEYIKRYMLYPIAQRTINSQVQDYLEKNSIPKISINERAFLDRHSKFTNNAFTYQTLSFNSYENVRDYYNSAVRNVNGVTSADEKFYREHHLGRQFNKVYDNWDKTKKSSGRWEGFTELYNLEKYGLSPTTFDTCVTSLLTIDGMLGQGVTQYYKINATFKTEHGKNIRNNGQIERAKLAEDYNFTASRTIDLEENPLSGDISSKDTIANNEAIRQGLQEVLSEIVQQIMEIPIPEQLTRAKIVNYELSDEQRAEIRSNRAARLAAFNDDEEQTQGQEEPQLNESYVNSIVQNVMKRIIK
jgi:hypothetical protein